jgi:hypothetical protein
MHLAIQKCSEINFMMKKRFLFFILVLIICGNTFANLRPIFLSIELRPVTTAANTKNIIHWNVVFTNLDSIRHAIVVPSSQNKGKRIIQLQWYKVTSSGSGIFPSSGDFYEQVYADPIELEMDTSLYRGYPSIVNLDPNESYTFPIFLNDRMNQFKHVESSYLVPTLPIQDYKVLVNYNPYYEPLSQHFFYHPEKGQFDLDSLNRLELPLGGIYSNYTTIHMQKDDFNTNLFFSKSCPKSCNFCNCIKHKRWKKLRKHFDKKSSDLSHGRVLHEFPGPDGVLDVLPTYYSKNYVVLTKDGVQHISVTWQIGKIYKVAHFFTRILYPVFHKVIFPYTNARVSKLKWIKEW